MSYKKKIKKKIMYQLIRLIILCIKVLRYTYKKMNSLRDILHSMSKFVKCCQLISQRIFN